VPQLLPPAYHCDVAASADDSARPELWEGLQGAWCLPGPTGNRVPDFSGYGNDALWTNAGYGFSVEGEPCHDFNGTNGFVEIPSLTRYESAQGNVSFWFRCRTIGNSSGDVILGKHTSASSRGGIEIAVFNNHAFFECHQDTAGATVVATADGPTTLAANEWHHLSFNWDTASGSSQQLFWDGSLFSSATASAAWGWSAGQVIRLADSLDAFWEIFDGQLRDVLWFNRRRSAGEVSDEANGLSLFHRRPRRKWLPVGVSAGGTTFPASLAGSSTAAGGLTRAVSKAAAGSVTGAGSLAKALAKPLAGSSTGAGSLAKLTAKPVAGSSTGTGAETHAAGKGLSGSSTAAGAETRSAAKALAGSSTGAGSLAKSTAKPSAGSSTPAGSEAHAAGKGLAGSTTAAGAETHAVAKSLAGSATPAGSIAKAVAKPAAGSATATGAETRAAAKALAGSETPAAAVAKAVSKSAAGGSTASGVLQGAGVAVVEVAGSLAGAGSLAKAAGKPLSGSAAGAGALAKAAGKSAAGSEVPAGSLAKEAAKPLAGSATPAGSTAKQANKAAAGSAAPSGGMVRSAARALAGVLAAAGSLAKLVARSLAGLVSAIGSLVTSGGVSGADVDVVDLVGTLPAAVDLVATLPAAVELTGTDSRDADITA
jgi:hypothetical protein